MVEILGVLQDYGEMILETYNRKVVLAGNTGKHVVYSRMVQKTTTSVKPCLFSEA